MIPYLKIKVVSLAAEARLIRQEENRFRKRKPSDRALAARQGLRQHRVGEIRPEARSACLAYAFLRGRTYQQAEGKAKSLPDWQRVGKLVERYCEAGPDSIARGFVNSREKQEVMLRFEAWKTPALERFALAA